MKYHLSLKILVEKTSEVKDKVNQVLELSTSMGHAISTSAGRTSMVNAQIDHMDLKRGVYNSIIGNGDRSGASLEEASAADTADALKVMSDAGEIRSVEQAQQKVIDAAKAALANAGENVDSSVLDALSQMEKASGELMGKIDGILARS